MSSSSPSSSVSSSSSPSSGVPRFCTPIDQEFPKLVAMYISNSSTGINQSSYNNKLHETNWNLQMIMRKYLSEFWRHQIEKECGNDKLWEEITGMHTRQQYWSEPSSSATSSSEKTRWQLVAEQLFCQLLQIKTFVAPNCVTSLVNLRNKQKAKGDHELTEIIDNYLSASAGSL
eukprot:TRINITY_DN5068_c0_g1_i1.p1 TRINITY_DN5068_c0_g1~~TRINITY_DN5068_c0_g1_i1.p1  ORF type:complete len:174 (-),score=40.31 TRINITY_DN5068_c0_g1_i1:257-778(-)